MVMMLFCLGQMQINILIKTQMNTLKKNIKALYQEYMHPTYNHCHNSFVAGCSFLDMLFNVGKKIHELLDKSNYKILSI